MEMEIADMGTKAQADGFTTAQARSTTLRMFLLHAVLCSMSPCRTAQWRCAFERDYACQPCTRGALQVLERVSAERALPAHTPTATTAEGAYKFSAIVKRADHKHLDLGYLQKAALDPMHLSSLRAGHMHGRRVDIFVDHILGLIRVGSDESAHAAATAACQWLGLFNVCRKVLRVRQGVTIVPEAEAADDDAAAELDGTSYVLCDAWVMLQCAVRLWHTEQSACGLCLRTLHKRVKVPMTRLLRSLCKQTQGSRACRGQARGRRARRVCAAHVADHVERPQAAARLRVRGGGAVGAEQVRGPRPRGRKHAVPEAAKARAPAQMHPGGLRHQVPRQHAAGGRGRGVSAVAEADATCRGAPPTNLRLPFTAS